MDPSVHNAPTVDEDDEWDTDGFVIPSLGIEDLNQSTTNAPLVEDSKHTIKDKKEEHIYLGPHGAPPSQAKQDVNYSGRKQRFKQKLKDADERIGGGGGGSGRENKLENLRDLVGGGKMPVIAPKSSNRDWLDPHCHESQFEKRYTS
ncbi:uncharacterized protein LOC111902254 [Lactuca sativa]|uniref:Uncharacterized protein n=1 Tax=Lactuca sativa TaxID=4236 RepID=A0A9R1VG52_LACSA|nr:uncharacterized protein LOC111902254 [Lactuca sativa]KAJ0205528.1 hypothetical protein LSAT_V11C500229340 [Lactuca sativa]